MDRDLGFRFPIQNSMDNVMEENGRILIVEDDRSLSRGLALFLEKKGYLTETAGSAQEALSKARRRFFNLALLDIELPDMQGTALLKPLKKMHPDMMMIMITGYASLETTVRSFNGGAAAYFIKPINLDELLGTVRKVLKKQYQEMEKRRLYQEIQQKLAESKETEERLVYLATHDALTGLPNRVLFHDRLTLELVRARRNKKKLAVMLLDLDHFKEINDRLGHSAGDRLLQLVGRRLTNLLRKSDSVVRIGGDEFLLLLPEIAQVKDAAKIAQKVLEAIRKPYRFDGHRIKITASLGISIFPNNGRDAESLLKNVDIAMYSAKEQGRDRYKFYSLKEGGKRSKGIHSGCKRHYRLVQDHVPSLLRSLIQDVPQ